MSELKECPFCGGKAHFQGADQGCDETPSSINVVCKDCDQGIWVIELGKLAAIKYQATKLWNTRPTEDSLRAEVERLQAKVRRVEEFRDHVAKDSMPLLRRDWFAHCLTAALKGER